MKKILLSIMLISIGVSSQLKNAKVGEYYEVSGNALALLREPKVSIDANVIVFERIKEELQLGKNVISAVKSGYNRAFVTILDANITTLIAAFVLANIGSGPIKGFAITLSIGIVCSMFTAIFITRTLYMIILKNGKQKLSI